MVASLTPHRVPGRRGHHLTAWMLTLLSCRSSFSETLGRRTIYVISFALFVLFSALSAISTNIGMLIALRILGGGASASVQAVGAGTIADIWPVRERGKAMSMSLSCRHPTL